MFPGRKNVRLRRSELSGSWTGTCARTRGMASAKPKAAKFHPYAP